LRQAQLLRTASEILQRSASPFSQVEALAIQSDIIAKLFK
jgi:hypothetical protein